MSKLFRMIVPVFPELNIYSYSKNAGSVVSAGALKVATMASKLQGWRVEVIDENNYHKGPRGKDSLPDHEQLQWENPADAVGFYCGLTCTIERVWELAKFYQERHVKTIAGGLHASTCPEETLRHNIDIVVHGDGEPVICDILANYQNIAYVHWNVPGVSYFFDGKVYHNSQKDFFLPHPQIPDMDEKLASLKNEVKDLDEQPFADFGLLRFAKIKVYPITRIRGCGMKCEFCSVNRPPIWSSARQLFEEVKWLVETRNAKKFFIVDDRMEEDLVGTVEFFQMVSQKFGARLHFFAQTRLRTAENREFLEIMKSAGVRALFIGCESPIDEDLKAMNKGYTSQKMLEWVKILRKNFWVHGMFIFGYPPKQKEEAGLCAKEMYRRFRKFIFKAGFDSIQILKPIPIVGTKLRKRLESENRILPMFLVPWKKYDGNSVCFIPRNMSVDDLHKYPIKLMKVFYSPVRSFWVILRTILFPFDYLVRGWTIGLSMGWLNMWSEWHARWFSKWHKEWYKDLVKCVGHLILVKWEKKQNESGMLERIKRHCASKKISKE